ncbi:MAG: peptide MFS transporter [Bacteroidaceae bacterium]|nr:peptide MFS transporter [Bacteroidaceae bacterium]
MFEGQPKGLYALALANTGERFGYYTMLAVFVLFLQANFGLTPAASMSIYSSFLMFVYFLPLFGGMAADRWGYGRMVTIGIFIMLAGYMLLAIPTGAGVTAYAFMFGALALVCAGTALFKGNLQVMVGNLYDAPEYAGKRDAAFSIFYMAINIGAMFAPTAAIKVMGYAQSIGFSEADSYHFAFGVACLSLVVSIAIYYGFRFTFRSAEGGKIKATDAQTEAAPVQELSKEETRSRIIALCLVYAVVIFFWMAFHQNGATLTQFAKDYTATSSSGLQSMMFDVRNLVAVIFLVYGLFGIFQSATNKARSIYGIVIAAALGYLYYQYTVLPDSVKVDAPIFQQFNPCFVVALTPVSLAIFGALAKRGKEPSAPVKIALGMLVAASAYLIMVIGSMGAPMPEFAADGQTQHMADFSPNWLVSTYLVLTFAELLLSPMGISFVSKVAPPKYKGLMMGGWFVATALGNQLVMIPGLIWGKVELMWVWALEAGICILSFLFLMSQMNKIKKVA